MLEVKVKGLVVIWFAEEEEKEEIRRVFTRAPNMIIKIRERKREREREKRVVIVDSFILCRVLSAILKDSPSVIIIVKEIVKTKHNGET